MCGIAGFVSETNPSEIELKLMSDALIHRGPDEEGFYFHPPAGLAIRRLSIIDVSGGHQPISDEAERFWVVFNGEIYNYEKLRSHLLKLGHRFKTNSDTEVIAHLYEIKGPSFLEDLVGMFSIAIWDKEEKQLLLARDRLGKKPLYYHLGPNGLWFASELKALTKLKFIQKSIDPYALENYLSFMYVPAPQSIYLTIKKLLPGHFLIYNSHKNKVNVQRYWSIDYLPKKNLMLKEAVGEFHELFFDAVKIRMLSERPLGAFLSGGIDSSLVVAAMAQLSNHPVKTFSIGFDNPNYDETTFANMVAKKFSTLHTELTIKPTIRTLLPKLVFQYDEPYGDSSAIPTYYLCELTRKSVVVSLSGDGGDELFAGYRRYISMLVFSSMPAFLKKEFIHKTIASLVPKQKDLNTLLGRVSRFLRAISADALDTYASTIFAFDNLTKKKLLSADLQKEIDINNSFELIDAIFQDGQSLELLDRFLRLDTLTYLPNDLLVKVDIASMAHSLEVRCPFLDHRVVEFAAKLPTKYKATFFKSKVILKEFAKDLLPPDIISRKKMGFGVPLASWFRHELSNLLDEFLANSHLARDGYLNQTYISQLIYQHKTGFDHSKQLWTLLALELWYQTVYENSL